MYHTAEPYTIWLHIVIRPDRRLSRKDICNTMLKNHPIAKNKRNCFQKLEGYQLNALSFSEYFIPMAGLRVTLIPQRTEAGFVFGQISSYPAHHETELGLFTCTGFPTRALSSSQIIISRCVLSNCGVFFNI